MKKKQGFTLVELLVVIAIIAMLVTLLLPAVQSAREAARRMQCVNNLKQMGIAVANHESAMGTLPGGGDTPWPAIQDYVDAAGNLFGAEKNGFSWAFQILPFMEEGAVQGISRDLAAGQAAATVQARLDGAVIPMYHCPTRREPKRQGNRVLMDYASATPQGGILRNGTTWVPYNVDDENSYWQGNIWAVPDDKRYFGLIVRANYDKVRKVTLGCTKPVTPGKVEDGMSKTVLIGEKRMNPDAYATGEWYDDRGWTDGWDPDVVRSTNHEIGIDIVTAKIRDNRNFGFHFGSAHLSGMNAVYGDGSVHTIDYSIDRAVWNSIGDRRDGSALANSGP
jgi:prepilin-type N-terminal cleavage/methylation domain-containing protein